jgi:hypothetical protein
MYPEASGSIAIVFFPEGWRIVARDHRWGRYQFRVDAEEAALRLAARARLMGQELEVLVQQPYGELRPLVA